jgi:uncharacterized membrane protein YhaH (DUF805 family)
MSWGDVFFAFRGRINRRTWWIGLLLVEALGVGFGALLAYLATGNPFAPEVWERPADKAALWGPVWLAYYGFLVWPSTALAVKRLHDRNRPVYVWYAYYVLSAALTLMPLKASLNAQPDPTFGALAVPLAVLAGYLFFELGVLRGAPGPNQHGPDTLPPDYYGGDYSFLSWMLAPEGRISRAKWWLGMLMLAGVVLALGGLVGSYLTSRHPEIEQHWKDPSWFSSPEAAPVVAALLPWDNLVAAILCLALWSSFALGVKRLHDRGLSSWLILVILLPFLAAIVAPAISENAARIAFLLLTASFIWSVLQFGILKGETGPNRHGPDPLAG